MMLPLGLLVFPYLYIQLDKIEKYNSKNFFFLSGLLYGLGFFNLLFIWLINPFLIYEETKPYFLLSFLFPIFLSIILGLIFIIFRYIKSDFTKIIFIPIIFVFFEIIISNLFYGFPWLIFALTISNNFIGLLLIKYFGTHFTSFLVICFFMLPTIFIYKKKIKIHFKVIIILFVFFLILISIFFSNLNYKNHNQTKYLTFELFQMNNEIKNSNSNDSDKIYRNIIDNIKNSEAELLIFSENNYPYLVNDFNDLEINSFLKGNQKILIGATRYEDEKYFNSILLMSKKENNFFDKKILVPFGEFLPFRKHLQFMEKISGTQDFTSGVSKRILKLNDKINIIPIICYEIIFFWRIMNFNNYSADILINITNDSWFGKKIGPYQHFYLSKIKAAEFNKILLRVSNNGISGVIDNYGSILQSTNLYEKKNIKGKLLINNNFNFFRLHKYFNIVLLIFFFSQFFLIFYKKNA